MSALDVVPADPPWLTVWCQGGDADGLKYATMVEPDAVIYLAPNPFQPGGTFMRVLHTWDDAVPYVRHPEVEQFDHERIYYPQDGVM